MGPSAIRYAGLAGTARRDSGYGPRLGRRRDRRARGDGRRIRARATCPRSWRPAGASRALVADARASRARCRSCSAATTRSRSGRSAGWRAAHGAGGVLWIDAHGDLNTPETLPTRQRARDAARRRARRRAATRFASDAWPLPALDPSRVALVGVRSLDARERELIARARHPRVHDERHRPARDRAGDARGARRVAGPGFVHVSLDLDSLDPEVAPGVGTPVRGGLSYREAHLALSSSRSRASPARSRWSR